MAPLGERVSGRGEAGAPEPPGASTTATDVISVDTDATGPLDGSVAGRSESDLGAEPPPGRPLRAATYNMPLSSKRSARISWKGESRRMNALPSGSTRRMRPGDPVPTRRLPALSKASAIACVALA